MQIETPDQRVLRYIRETKEVKRTGNQKVYWRLIAELCKRDLWFLLRFALGYGWLDEDLIGGKLCGFYDSNEGRDTAVFIPRGFGKTLVDQARILQKIFRSPDIAIMYASATAELADDFGSALGRIILGNEIIQRAFHDILPNGTSQIERWGKDGYTIPGRKPRIDPTLSCFSMRANVTGRHPDDAFLDDLIVRTNNDPNGWDRATLFIKEMKLMLPSYGTISMTGTRWHDGDPYGKIIAGIMTGKQGKFATLVESCWVDDNPLLEKSTYPKKIRWDMDKPTGYDHEYFVAQQAPEDQGGMGKFFSAQMRNDPKPDDQCDIRLNYVNIYKPEELPELSHVRSLGIEVTGGGRPIYSHLREKAEELRKFLPLVEVTKKKNQGETKADRIRGALEPIVSSGRLWGQQWMIGDGGQSGTLGYELKRLGVATHDDIVDALHYVPRFLSCGVSPDDGDPAHVYISVDLAYTENQSSDFTVIIAVAVDSKQNYWVLDYDRFQSSSPTGIVDRILKFFCKWSTEEERPRKRRSNFNYAMSYK
jgi:hypothetical protein